MDIHVSTSTFKDCLYCGKIIIRLKTKNQKQKTKKEYKKRQSTMNSRNNNCIAKMNIGIKVLHKIITLTGKLIANKLSISKC